MRGLTVDCPLPFEPPAQQVELIPDAVVTGIGVPDVTGNYFWHSMHAGEDVYKHESKDWYSYYRTGGPWLIFSSISDSPSGPHFNRLFSSRFGTYTPTNGATGSPVLSLP